MLARSARRLADRRRAPAGSALFAPATGHATGEPAYAVPDPAAEEQFALTSQAAGCRALIELLDDADAFVAAAMGRRKPRHRDAAGSFRLSPREAEVLHLWAWRRRQTGRLRPKREVVPHRPRLAKGSSARKRPRHGACCS